MSDLLQKIIAKTKEAVDAKVEVLEIKEEVEVFHKKIKSVIDDNEKWTRDAMQLMQDTVDTMQDISTNYNPDEPVRSDITSVSPDKVSYKIIIIACLSSSLITSILTSIFIKNIT